MARKLALVLVVGAAVGLAGRSMRADGPDGVPPPVVPIPNATGGPPVPVVPHANPVDDIPRMPSPAVPATPRPVSPPPPVVVARGGFHFVTSTAVWSLRTDDELDGKMPRFLSSSWRLTIRNNRILGGPDAPREAGYAGHHLSGEISGGDTPVVTLRQEGPNGYVRLLAGRAGEDGRMTGAWFDNRGMSGDFELAPERGQ